MDIFKDPFVDLPSCLATFDNFYSHVIADVLERTTEHFLEEGVGLETLQELKTLWRNRMEEHVNQARVKAEKQRAFMAVLHAAGQAACDQNKAREQLPKADEVKHELDDGDEYVPFVLPTPEEHVSVERWQQAHCTVPVQVNVMAEVPFVVTVRISHEQLVDNRVGTLFTPDILSGLTSLTPDEATYRLQTIVADDLKNYAPKLKVYYIDRGEQVQPRQVDGTDGDEDSKMAAVTSTDSQSGSDDDKDEDTLDDDDDDVNLKELLGDEASDSEPDLDSNDDITDEEAEPEYSDNLILCQYTHVKRHKSLWKFRFENGIMMIDGVEYIFQRATGEGVW